MVHDPNFLQQLISTYHDCMLDSNMVAENDIFFALQGVQSHGKNYIKQAVDRGASLVIGDDIDNAICPIAYKNIANPRQMHALLKHAFYPNTLRHIAAITGTNGKSSCAYFLEQLWYQQAHHSCSIGTLGCHISNKKGQYWYDEAHLTSPQPDILYPLLKLLAHQDDISHCALEASSHGLEQYRLDGLHINTAIFSSFSRDHLDYHVTMKHYAEAKLRLFYDVADKDALFIWPEHLALHQQLLAYSQAHHKKHLVLGRDMVINNHYYHAQGQEVSIEYQGQNHEFFLPLLGGFQVDNFLLSMMAAYQNQALPNNVNTITQHVHAVPGRMELIPNKHHYTILVDYAHTPDALQHVLITLKNHNKGRLIVVFGCGGNRDEGKRPLMGSIAHHHADITIITDDNPRYENPAFIRQAIHDAAPNAYNIGDRVLAIHHAIDMYKQGDIIVVAGKGHEEGQIINNVTYPCSDKQIIMDYIGS